MAAAVTLPSDQSSPVVVSVVGPSGVGKTTLVEQLIAELVDRGLHVGSVKHAPHGFDVDRPGSDSHRHRAAGAHRVLLAGSGQAVLFIDEGRGIDTSDGEKRSGHHARDCALGEAPSTTGDRAAEHSRQAALVTGWISEHLGRCDVVVVEGFTPLSRLVVEVARDGFAAKPGNEVHASTVTVTDRPDGSGGQIGFDQLDVLVAWIVGALSSARR